MLQTVMWTMVTMLDHAPGPPPTALPWADALLSDFPYIPHAQGNAILERLEFLLNAQASGARVVGIRLTGPTNTGKTSSVLELLRRHPPARGPTGLMCPVLLIRLQERATLVSVYRAILKALGSPAWNQGLDKNVRGMALDLMQHCGVRMVIVDEPHHLTAARSEGARVGLAQMGKVLIDEGMLVVFCGVHSIDDLLSSEELARRYPVHLATSPYRLNKPQDLKELRHFFDLVGQQWKDLEPVPLGSDDNWFVPLAATSAGAIGTAMPVLQLAVVHARSIGAKTLELKHVVLMWEQYMQQSRESHLRHLETTSGRLKNPFRSYETALEILGQLSSVKK